jgi:hypothetical protein
MRGVKRTLPLRILCQRQGCENVLDVRCPAEQRRRKYCSRRCANLVNRNILRAWRKGVDGSVRKRQRQVLARVAGLTPLEAFRLGYKRGLYSKLRQVKRQYVLVKKLGSAP